MKKQRKPKSIPGRWAIVSVIGGPELLAWVDARRWNGWLVPWLPDASMLKLKETDWIDGLQILQDHGGSFELVKGADEVDELDRHRKIVHGVPVALTDTAEMCWCWDLVRDDAESVGKAIRDAGLDR